MVQAVFASGPCSRASPARRAYSVPPRSWAHGLLGLIVGLLPGASSGRPPGHPGSPGSKYRVLKDLSLTMVLSVYFARSSSLEPCKTSYFKLRKQPPKTHPKGPPTHYPWGLNPKPEGFFGGPISPQTTILFSLRHARFLSHIQITVTSQSPPEGPRKAKNYTKPTKLFDVYESAWKPTF